LFSEAPEKLARDVKRTHEIVQEAIEDILRDKGKKETFRFDFKQKTIMRLTTRSSFPLTKRTELC
jgi:hypothetical protein